MELSIVRFASSRPSTEVCPPSSAHKWAVVREGAECERTFPIPEPHITSIQQLPHAVVIHVLADELRKKEVDAIGKSIDEARLAAPTMPFILDLAGVSFVPSVGMGTLVGLNQEFRGRGQRLIFAGMQPEVRRSFTVARVHQIMEIVDDLPAALRAVGAK